MGRILNSCDKRARDQLTSWQQGCTATAHRGKDTLLLLLLRHSVLTVLTILHVKVVSLEDIIATTVIAHHCDTVC